MSHSCSTTLPLSFSSGSSPVDLSAELDKEIQGKLHLIARSSSSFAGLEANQTPLRNRIIKLSTSGSIIIDFLPEPGPQLTQEEKLKSFAESYSSHLFCKNDLRPAVQEQLFHAWVACLMTRAPQAYETAQEMITELPQASPLCEKLFHSLLLLGDFGRRECQNLAIRLVMKGLNLNLCHERLGTPLHIACALGFTELAQKILTMTSEACRLDERDEEGFTAAARLAEYRERHGETPEIKKLITCFANRIVTDKNRHLAPSERFDEWVHSQGYVENAYPPALPLAYKDYHALLLKEHYQTQKRSKHRKTASSGALSTLKRQLSSSRAHIPLPAPAPSGIEADIAYLIRRFESGHYPSSQRVYEVLCSLVDGGKWKLVDEVLALISDHGATRYESLLHKIKQEMEQSSAGQMASQKRRAKIDTLLKGPGLHSLIL